MRISTSQLFRIGVTSILDNQSRLTRSQLEISSGRRILQPSDDPVGAVRSVGLSRAVERTQQYQRNIDQAEGRLRLEESTLANAIGTLQRVNELALQANNAGQTNETRRMIAAEVREQLESLLQYANTTDSNGRYLFSGFKEETVAFSRSGDSFVYNGDDGQRQFQIGPSRLLSAGDPGSAVFAGIRDGNGTFSTAANSANTGIGIIDGGEVTDPTQYDGDTYTIRFTAPDSYEVLDSGGAAVTTGGFSPGDAVAFRGVTVTISGQPAAGDEFTVAPSRQRDVLGMVQELVTALEDTRTSPAQRSAQTSEINSVLSNLQRSLDHLVEFRSSAGARLRTLEQQADINEGAGVQFQETLSSIRDADITESISRFNQQLLSLQAAQQTFRQVQGLSLFNFL